MSNTRIVSFEHPNGHVEAGIVENRGNEVLVPGGPFGPDHVYGKGGGTVHYDGGTRAICGRGGEQAQSSSSGTKSYKGGESRRC